MTEFMETPESQNMNENLKALEAEFGDQFLGYTPDALLAEGSIIPKIFI